MDRLRQHDDDRLRFTPIGPPEQPRDPEAARARGKATQAAVQSKASPPRRFSWESER